MKNKTNQQVKNKAMVDFGRGLLASAKRVLVVDDDQDMLAAISSMVQQNAPQLECVCVDNPYEALEKLHSENFDMILTDLKLPEISGTLILEKMDKQISSDSAYAESGRFDKKLPVYVMSGEKNNLSFDKKLKNFKLMKFIKKSELSNFIETRQLNAV